MLPRTLMPLILLAATLAIFFVYAKPAYRRVMAVREEAALLRGTLESARDVQALRDALVSQYNTFPQTDLERLEKMLPDHVDTVRLIMEIDAVATRYGMTVEDLKVGESVDPQGQSEAPGTSRRGEENPLGTVSLSFSVSSSYEAFLQFLRDIEQSLRLVDITELTFAPAIASEGGRAVANFYTFDVTLQTYWLR